MLVRLSGQLDGVFVMSVVDGTDRHDPRGSNPDKPDSIERHWPPVDVSPRRVGSLLGCLDEKVGGLDAYAPFYDWRLRARSAGATSPLASMAGGVRGPVFELGW